jgi:hypothetical protein
VKYRGAIKLSAPVAIVIVIIAAAILYWSVSKSGFFVQHGNVPIGPPSSGPATGYPAGGGASASGVPTGPGGSGQGGGAMRAPSAPTK